MRVIDREFKNYKKEAQIQAEIFSIDGYTAEEVYEIAQHMVKHIEPIVIKIRERRDRMKKANLITDNA